MKKFKVYDKVDKLIHAYFQQEIDNTDLCIHLLNDFNVRVCRVTENRIDVYDIDDHEFNVYTSDDKTNTELARLSEELTCADHDSVQTSLKAIAKECADHISMWHLDTDNCIFRLEVVKAAYHPKD